MQEHEKGFTVIIEHKDRIESGELDYLLKKDFIDVNDEEAYDMYSEIQTQYKSDAAPIKIDDMIKHLQDLKEKGCSYVEIDFNCDHYDYTFYGLDVRKATDEEVESENVKINAELEKRRKVQELQDQIRKIQTL
jgi:hypothetical protein